MKLRAVIVDDERPARDRLRRMLAAHPDVEIVGEAADGATAVVLVESQSPDLMFLDVQMPAGNAFDVLARLETPPRVIFTTAFDQYAVRAFEAHALDYLLKPFSAARLAAALDRAREALAAEAPGPDLARLIESIRAGLVPASAPVRIPARRGPRIVLLDPDEVLWFEAEETLVFARTAEGRHLVERSLSELEAQLGAGFFRAHRAVLVNLSHVAEIRPEEAGTYTIVMRDPQRTALPLSRRQAQKLRAVIPW